MRKDQVRGSTSLKHCLKNWECGHFLLALDLFKKDSLMEKKTEDRSLCACATSNFSGFREPLTLQ